MSKLKFGVYYRSLSPEHKKRLAKNCMSSSGYMHHLSSGFRIPSERMKWIIKEVTGSEFEWPTKIREKLIADVEGCPVCSSGNIEADDGTDSGVIGKFTNCFCYDCKHFWTVKGRRPFPK